MINFNCTSCGQLMSVRPDFAGRPGNCPQCRSPFVVPSPGAPSAPPASPSTPPGFAPLPPAPAAQGAPGAPKVEVVHGPSGFVGKSFPIDRAAPTVLGRDPAATLRIPSERVSRRHCEIHPSPQGYLVKDLGSSNGTLVNQQRIPGAQRLQSGDYIQAGDCLFRFTF